MFKNLQKLLTQTKPMQTLDLRRRWVETADERCPLACTWFALPATADDSDEAPSELPQSTWPVFSLRGKSRMIARHSSLYGSLSPIALSVRTDL